MVSFHSYLKTRIAQGATVEVIAKECALTSREVHKWIRRYKISTARNEARVYFLRARGAPLLTIAEITGLHIMQVRKFVARFEGRPKRTRRLLRAA